jgi:two-component system, cell cycle sensor histidine kinase and response regulator CckA
VIFVGECEMSEYFISFVFVFIFIFAAVVLIFNLSLRKLVKKKTGELQKEKNFLNYAMESTNTNINITDSDYNLKYVDPGWVKIYGDPTGRKCYEYFMGRDKPCEVCGMPEAMEKKEIIVYEEVMPGENNRVVEVHTIPFQEPDGTWLFAEFNVDITKRKRAEEALQTAQRLESLGILAGGIAHDFNNLLAGIFGNITIATEMIKESEASEYLLKASSAIDRAKGLTTQLLTFAKGGEPVKKRDSLTPFIEETVNFALSGSNILCEFEIAENLSLCEYDRNQIGQVIDNLVINAKQAMSGAGKIEVCAENIVISDDGSKKFSFGKYIKITITDHGTGIPEEILPKIFDPFFTTKAKGAGLGLATSFSIIKRHGGFIDVKSKPGEGSSFVVFLPATTGTLSRDDEKIAIKHKGSGTFLVMDDQELISSMLAKVLESFGYSTVCKEDGESAVKYFKENRKDIKAMIFDLTIPGGMGGLEAVSKVREIDVEVPVFVSSGYADDPAIANPEKYGFTASIAKPFKKKDLTIVLNKHLK